MSLDEYTYFDGRKVSFDREKVVQIEPHQSGQGTLVRLLLADHMSEMHLAEEYPFLLGRLTENWVQRGFREMRENEEAGLESSGEFTKVEEPF